MKLLATLLVCAVLQSCHVNNLRKKDQHALYINTIVPARTFLEISTEDSGTFSVDAINKSSDNIVLTTDTSEVMMKKNNTYSLTIGEKKNLRIKNISGQEIGIKLKVYNHSSKVIQQLNKL